MQIANINEAKTHLSHLVECALAGEDIVIARAGTPLVRLIPVEHDSRPREGGQLQGKLWIAQDFDAPDEEIGKLFYGDGK